MSARILDGAALARQLQQEIFEESNHLKAHSGITPKLTAILVGEDPASQIYVRSKQRACARVGIASQLIRLPESASQNELLQQLAAWNEDAETHGILVQLPLPKQIAEQMVLDAVLPEKDVDAFHPVNAGKLLQGRPDFLPCTPHGIQVLLHRHDIPVAGRHVVIVGRSNIVGKPLAALLMQRDSYLGPSAANATVTVCHSRTHNLADITRSAEILVVAIGQPEFLRAEMVRSEAVVVDVGSNRVGKAFLGDVAFDEVSRVASAITPVPGGVGPLTVTMLLRNTLTAAQLAAARTAAT